MQYLHQILSVIATLAINITSYLGYPGIFVLMAAESMVIPLPSELVMPFAGFLVSTGRFNFALAIIASTLGSLAGSLISYWLGAYGGEKIVIRWGRYLLLDTEDLKQTEKWFAKRGDITIFIGRFIPVVRHLISVPAGIGKMNLKKFIAFTLSGAACWNTILLILGYLLGVNWEYIRKFSEYFSLPLAGLIILALIYLAYRHAVKKKRKK